jgi:hypothetical protein
MVMALNSERFTGLGDQFVTEKATCYTCHAGSEVPRRAPDAGWTRGGFSCRPDRSSSKGPEENKVPIVAADAFRRAAILLLSAVHPELPHEEHALVDQCLQPPRGW